MYKNLLHSPDNASDDEIAQLNERRRQEKELILERDMDRPIMEGSQHSSSQYWFMISSDWLYRWKCFVSNKISSVTRERQFSSGSHHGAKGDFKESGALILLFLLLE
jgi:hypothetical protein